MIALAIGMGYLLAALWLARRLAWEWNHASNKNKNDSDQVRRIGAVALSVFLFPIAVISLLGFREDNGFDRPPRYLRKNLAEEKREQRLVETKRVVKQLQREIDALGKD